MSIFIEFKAGFTIQESYHGESTGRGLQHFISQTYISMCDTCTYLLWPFTPPGA